jgi:hypothetical protein
MKYAVKMDSSAMIYRPNFLKICSRIKKLIGGGGMHKHTDRTAISYATFTFSK